MIVEGNVHKKNTVMILRFRTDWSGQIVQTQIRLLLEEHSDQCLHYLQYCLHLLDTLLYVKPLFSSLRMITAKFSCVQKFRNFLVIHYVSFMPLCHIVSSPEPKAQR